MPKWEQAADMQLTAADLGYAVDALVDGAYATDYYTGGDKIDLRIVGEEQFAKQHAGPGVAADRHAHRAARAAGGGGRRANHAAARSRSTTARGSGRSRIQVTPPLDMPLEEAMDRISDADRRAAAGQRRARRAATSINLAGTADKLRSTWNALQLEPASGACSSPTC